LDAAGGDTTAELMGGANHHPTVAQAPATQPADIFSQATTRPAAPSDWTVRVINGSESGLIKLKLPPARDEPTYTGAGE
jgi:hypothetical protein